MTITELISEDIKLFFERIFFKKNEISSCFDRVQKSTKGLSKILNVKKGYIHVRACSLVLAAFFPARHLLRPFSLQHE